MSFLAGMSPEPQYATPTPKAQEANRPVCDHGITHLCLDVTDVDEEYKRLTAAGMVSHSEPLWVSESVKTVYARDPDGNVVELQEIMANTDDEKLIGVPQFMVKS
ncbi:MAG TPA: hypothetical protein ENI05_00930 [Porticoccus sp.]|nr:hypothetical protein [Porticoccus sp.]